MTTPTSHHPRRGRMAVAAATAVVLVVVGLVLFVTAGPNRSGDPAQAVAGAPSLTSTTPYAPSLPPLAGAAVGGSVSTPGHPSPGAVADGPVSPPGSDAGGPGAPPAASGVPAPGAAVPGQPGSSGGQAVPGGVVVPGQPGSSSNAAPGAATGNTGGPTPGGPAGGSGNSGNAAPGGTGGGSSGVSTSARAAALAGAPATMPAGTIALPSLGVGPVGTGPSCAEPNGILEPPSSQGPMTCSWRGSVPLDSSSGMFTEVSHVNYNGRQGAFSRLSMLRPGDPVFTASSTGQVQAWVVTREYARSKTLPLDTSAFQGPDGPRALALVSCGGKLTGRSYDDNIFAFAVPV